MNRFRIWVAASRPKTLTAAIVPVLVGTMLARADGYALRIDVFLCALLGAICIQIGTNLVNDALDFKRGADEGRLGPRRVTQAGLLKPHETLRGAYVAFAMAAVFGVPLVIVGGWPLLATGLASILAAYAYTGGPYPLAYLGLGDVFVVLFFGFVAVGGSFYLQSGMLNLDALVAGLLVGALATVLLAVNNLRDIETDRRSRKRTLAVRFGAGFARAEIALCCLLPFAMGIYWWMRGHRALAVVPLLAAPLAVSLLRVVFKNSGRDLNSALGRSAALHALYGLLFSLGLALGI